MNIFSKITLKTLRKNKTRTAVTIIGIILSTALVCAVTTSISSLQTFALKNMIYEYGDWHGAARDVDLDTVNTIGLSDEVEETSADNILGYAKLEECRNESKPYLYIIGADDEFFEMMPVNITSGRIPKNTEEIILPEHLRIDGGITYELGDVITLDIGDRISEGYLLGQNNPYNAYDEYTGEKLEASESLNIRERRIYTVVGFYERPDFENYSAPGYTAITAMDSDPAGSFDVYFKMEDPKTVYRFMSENGLGSDTNTNVLMFLGAARYDSFYNVLYSLAAIVTILIVFGSVSLIYNAFSISVSERTKQFGLLSSIGATRRQLRRSVQFEALTVSAIGIPLGILVGIAGIGVTLHLIGDSFVSLGSFKIPMSLSVSPLAIIAAVLISLITVFISVVIPARRATKITAIDAIRQNLDISDKAKWKKTSKITYKIFGLPGVLASKYYKRSRKKYRATVVSLFMSVVLFVSASTFTGYLNSSVEVGFDTKGYDLSYYQTPNDQELIEPEKLLQLLSEDEYVTDSAMTVEREYMAVIDREYMTKEAEQYIDAGYWNEAEGIGATVCFVSDEFYKTFLEEQGVDVERYLNIQKPLAYAIDGRSVFDYESQRFVQVKLLNSDNSTIEIKKYKAIEGYYLDSVRDEGDGKAVCIYQSDSNEQDVLEIPESEAVMQIHVNVGHVSYEMPFFIDASSMLTLLLPMSAMESIVEQNETYFVNFLFKSENHAESYNNMHETLVDNGLKEYRLNDYAKIAEQYRNIILIVNVFAYGFIVLISLIAAANVFNTITTNINLRKRDFAMLKSVGMAQKEFNKMMNYECLLYGSRALLYGLPVSILISWFIFKSVSYGMDISFQLPWTAIGIAVLSVFVVVFVTMMYSMRKLKNDNPIDTMKNENL